MSNPKDSALQKFLDETVPYFAPDGTKAVYPELDQMHRQKVKADLVFVESSLPQSKKRKKA